jgi:hypothetical protein
MHFELATEGIGARIVQLFIDQISEPSELPRGALIAMLALACWLIPALLVWGAISLMGG